MNKIKRITHFVETNADKFYKLLKLTVNGMQDEGLEVEVQYSTVTNSHEIGHIALVLGRKVDTQ